MQTVSKVQDTNDFQIYNRLLDLVSFYGNLDTKHPDLLRHLDNLNNTYGDGRVSFVSLLINITKKAV